MAACVGVPMAGARRAIRSMANAHASLLSTGVLLAAALVPTLVTPIPAMVDYVNHLARMHLLVAGAEPSPFYRIAWGLYPNLAIDLLVPQVAEFVGVETATRLFLLASQVLIVTGAAALEPAVKGRLAIAGPIAVIFLFSVPFAWGFLNFEFALGVALWGIAAWVLLAGRNWVLRIAPLSPCSSSGIFSRSASMASPWASTNSGRLGAVAPRRQLSWAR